MRLAVKEALKVLRATQPTNYIATTLTRSLLNSTGLKSEFVIKHLHRFGLVQCKLPNGQVLSLESNGDDWVPNQVFWRGWSGYEPETIPLFFRLASKAKITLDIGAHIGIFALLAGHANPRGQVYAFEPLPAIYARLKHNVSLNKLHNISCINSALSDFSGTTEIFHQPGIPLTASLSANFMHWQKDWKPSVVSVLTADQFIEENGLNQVDLIKIDTESTEPQVLKGMLMALERDHPNIICEVLPNIEVEMVLTEFLRPLGYYFYHLTDKGPILQGKFKGSVTFMNYLFTTVPAGKISQM